MTAVMPPVILLVSNSHLNRATNSFEILGLGFMEKLAHTHHSVYLNTDEILHFLGCVTVNTVTYSPN